MKMKISIIFLMLFQTIYPSLIHQAIPYLDLSVNKASVRNSLPGLHNVDLSKIVIDYWDYLIKDIGNPNLMNLITDQTEQNGFQELGLTAQDIQDIKRMVNKYKITFPTQTSGDVPYSIITFAHATLPKWLENNYKDITSEIIHEIVSNEQYDFLGPINIRTSVAELILQEQLQRTYGHSFYLYKHKNAAKDINHVQIEDFKKYIKDILYGNNQRCLYINPNPTAKNLSQNNDDQLLPQNNDQLEYIIVEAQNLANQINAINNLLDATTGGNPNLAVIIAFDNNVTSIPDNFNIGRCNAVHIKIAGIKIRSIGHNFLENCIELKTLILPSRITQIGNSFLRNCIALTSITLPQGLTQIDNYFLMGCIALISITLPQGLTQIGHGFLRGCAALTSITLPQGLTQVGDYFLQGCSALTSITLPQGLTQVGRYFLEDCTRLISIALPQGLIHIGSYFLANCRALTSITLPQGLIHIGYFFLEGCINLRSITLSAQTNQALENKSINLAQQFQNATITVI